MYRISRTPSRTPSGSAPTPMRKGFPRRKQAFRQRGGTMKTFDGGRAPAAPIKGETSVDRTPSAPVKGDTLDRVPAGSGDYLSKLAAMSKGAGLGIARPKRRPRPQRLGRGLRKIL